MNILSAATIASLENGINALIDAHPKAGAELAKLSGKKVQVTILPRAQGVQLLFCEEGVVLRSQTEEPADVELRGTVTQLYQLIARPRSVLFGQGVEVVGDATLIQRIQKAVELSELEWEELVANRIGDLPASVLIRLQRIFRGYKTDLDTSAEQGIRDYLQEELRLLPSQVEFEYWQEQVQSASQKSQALEDRLERLQRLKS